MPLQGVTAIQLGREREERSASEGQVQEKPRQLNAACFDTHTKGLPFKSFILSSKLCYFLLRFFFSLTPCWTVETGPNKASPRQLRRPQQVSRVRCQTLSHIPRPQRAPTFSHNCSSVFDPRQQSFHVFTRKAAHWGGVSPGWYKWSVVQVKTTTFTTFYNFEHPFVFLFLKA